MDQGIYFIILSHRSSCSSRMAIESPRSVFYYKRSDILFVLKWKLALLSVPIFFDYANFVRLLRDDEQNFSVNFL